MLNRQSY